MPLIRSRFVRLLRAGLFPVLPVATIVPAWSDGVSYFRDVRPVFESQCHGCHQPAKAQGGFVMTEFEKLLAGGDGGDAIVPGDPDASELVRMITPGPEGDAEMPQKKPPLSAETIAVIRQWIQEGAKDDTPADAYIKYTAENPPVYARPPVIPSIDWSPDGRWIAVAGHSEILLHRADGSGLEARLIGKSERIESLAFSPDSRLLAATGGNPGRSGEVQLWEVGSHRLVRSHDESYDTLYGAAWSPDGRYLSFGCGDHGNNTIHAIDAATGEEVLTNSAHDDWALDTVWSTDGAYVVSVGRDMAAKLTEVSTQRFIDNITSITPGALRGGLHSVDRHPNRDEIAVGGADGVPQIYRMHRVTARVIGDNANLIRKFPAMPGRVFGVAYSPDGGRLAAVSSDGPDGHLFVYHAEFDSTMPDDIKAIVQKVGHSPEEAAKLEAWVTSGVRTLQQVEMPGVRLYALDFSPDGSRIAVAGQDGRVYILDAASGAILLSFDAAPVHAGEIARSRPEPTASPSSAPAPAAPPEPVPDPAEVVSLEADPPAVELRGPTDACQMVVTARRRDGSTVDVTRFAAVEWPESAGTVSRSGVLRAAADGQSTVTFTYGEARVSVPVVAAGTSDPLRPDYVRDVMPVISKLGCNAGTCHGANDGKNGFKLSLRGYDPVFDVLALTDEQASRRSNAAVPDSSLFLEKASAAVPHEGGQLTVPGEVSYEILRAWIAQGGTADFSSPRVASIAIHPQNPVVGTVGARQQMRVVATYSDGRTRDVTGESFIESGNQDVAVTTSSGLVMTLRRGEAPVLARFEGAYAATTVTVMGDRNGFVWNDPPAYGEIDRLVAEKWRRMKILPSELSTDAEFLRRVYLDLTGLPPTEAETVAFLADSRDTREKREEVIDRLIGSPAWVEYWTNKWSDLLQVNGRFLGREGAEKFRAWIRSEVEANTPWNEFARKILTSDGSNAQNPAASYFKILRTPEDLMENTTHLFLATRFNCNKCHDHPFERWTQDQYYQTAAWFAQVGRKPAPESGGRTVGGSAVENAQPLFEVIEDLPEGEIRHERTKSVTPPAFPYPAEYSREPEMARRDEFAAWLVSADNRYFATSFVNRIWGYLLGTGIIEPLDDIRAGNPPSNPELLEYLRREFVDSGFDVRKLMALICKSRTYQLSFRTGPWNADDATNFSHALARRLPAEALFDSIMAVTGSQPDIPGVTPGTRAAALPDAALDLPSGFLANLGRPVRESACECERSNDVQLGPVMALLGGPVVARAIADPHNAIAALVREEQDDRRLIERLFLRILNRPPSPEEIDTTLEAWQMLDADHEKLKSDLAEAEREYAPQRVVAEVAREEAIVRAKAALEACRPEAEARQKAAADAREAAIRSAQDAIAAADAARAETIAGWQHPHASPESPVWHPVRIVSAKATGGVTLTTQPDGTIVASGPPAQTDYTIVIEPSVAAVGAVILEVEPDAALPGAGPGRAPNGNFVVNQVQAKWESLTDPSRKGRVEFQGAKATFSQEGFDPAHAIAGNADPGKGWALAGAPATRHSAAFGLKEPLEEAGGVRLTVTLRHRYPDNLHTLGRFRLWVAAGPNTLEPGVPAAVRAALATIPPHRTPEQNALLAEEAGRLDPERGAMLRALVQASMPVPPDEELQRHEAALAEAEKPVPVPPRLVRLREDMAQSIRQIADRRLTAAQDLTWALINSPAFLFNH